MSHEGEGPRQIRVSAGGVLSTIHVRREGETVVVEHEDRWQQRLSLEEAWHLAEALDAVATEDGSGS